MANIIDYLDWRGDIGFDISPFNEIDNLILSQMCYTDFEGVITQDDTLSIVDTARLYFEIHTEEEILGRDTFYKMAPMVLKKAARTKRFQEVQLKNYINLISMDREEQFSALTFVLPDGMQYVAFRGTDNTLVGWKEDFNLCFMSETAGQKRAVEYVNYYFDSEGGDIILGGHSKGGNFAIYSAAFCEQQVQDRIVGIYSNDGPGFRDEILETEEYNTILPKIRCFIPSDSMVGILLENQCDYEIVKTDAKGINQHDPMSWQVLGEKFVPAEKRGEGSKLIDKTMVKWLSEISDDERQAFIDTVFATLDNSGVKTINDLSEGGIKKLSELVKKVKSLPADKQAEMSSIVKRFLQIGSDYAFTGIKDKVRIPREKKRIRKQMIERRKKLPKLQVKERSENICQKIVSSETYKNAEKILVYMSIQNEVNMSYLIKSARRDGKMVYIPRVVSDTEMKFFRYNGRFVRGNFDIREPAGNIEFDFQGNTLLILPGVAYDKDNNRLGHGGGYYDRFIEAFRQSDFEQKYELDIFAVGYDFQVVDKLPAGEHDQKPDEVITG